MFKKIISIYHTHHSSFPPTLEDAGFNGLTGQKAVSAEMVEDGLLRIGLAKIFGRKKFIEMTAHIEDNEIINWECRSNVSAGTMKDTYCLPWE
ncbi:hypothetical protein AB833_31470 [Chromatiales bacterium (ex Bugula neritina AB1)]|nr:hypothetical protein AB833_31470 [Chromatiales bacterium (ex Bugula neritina AB1)]